MKPPVKLKLIVNNLINTYNKNIVLVDGQVLVQKTKGDYHQYVVTPPEPWRLPTGEPVAFNESLALGSELVYTNIINYIDVEPFCDLSVRDTTRLNAWLILDMWVGGETNIPGLVDGVPSNNRFLTEINVDCTSGMSITC